MNREVVLAAIQQEGYAFEPSMHLLTDLIISVFGERIVSSCWLLFEKLRWLCAPVCLGRYAGGLRGVEYASVELWANRELVLIAVAKNALALKYISDELKTDRIFVYD